MAAIETVIRGFASAVSPLTEALLAADTRDVGAGLRARGNYLPSLKKIPLSRYYSTEYAALEREHLWKKVWQFACREEDIPNVGDRAPYTVGDLSFVVVRSSPHEFRAFYNTCLHRGTRLCDGVGSGASLRCPFHAWEWNLDGSLKNIPSRWDFAQVASADYRLPEVKVGTWGGLFSSIPIRTRLHWPPVWACFRNSLRRAPPRIVSRPFTSANACAPIGK